MVYLDADAGEDGLPGLQGNPGLDGATGQIIYLEPEQGDDGDMGPVGPAGVLDLSLLPIATYTVKGIATLPSDILPQEGPVPSEWIGLGNPVRSEWDSSNPRTENIPPYLGNLVASE